jgi:AraC family ethanolamine operon transcriptional activator
MQSRVFHDFDAFAESIRDVDSRMLLRNPQRRVWSVSSVDLGRVNVQLGKLGSGNIARGQLRSDGYMLYLPLTDGIEYSANGSVLEENSFAILEPGCEFCISTKAHHDWCVAFVPTDLLAKGGEFAVQPSRACRVTRPNQLAAEEFRTTLLQIFSTAANSRFESSHAATRAAKELVQIASLIVKEKQAASSGHEGRPRIPRERIIPSCMDFLELHTDKTIAVSDLATVAGVSERTVRTAFKEYFGVSPIRYLQLRRLHKIHRALRVADPEEATVSTILIEHGEWEFSRFASRYYRLFGRLPSETLRTFRRSNLA